MKTLYNPKFYLFILFFVASIVASSQTSTFNTTAVMYKYITPLTDQEAEWSVPQSVSLAIQFDVSQNTIVLTGGTVDQKYSIISSQPVINGEVWNKKKFVCLDEAGGKVWVEIRKKNDDSEIQILIANTLIIRAYSISMD